MDKKQVTDKFWWRDDENEPVWCPHFKDWIHPIECGNCEVLRNDEYKKCQYDRVFNPGDTRFKPTEPKPMVW